MLLDVRIGLSHYVEFHAPFNGVLPDVLFLGNGGDQWSSFLDIQKALSPAQCRSNLDLILGASGRVRTP
jgi:hypothetical protein